MAKMLFIFEDESSEENKSIKNVHCKCDSHWQRRRGRLFSFDMDIVVLRQFHSFVRSIVSLRRNRRNNNK